MRHHGTTVFTRMSALAARYDAVNLGQGFPDSDPPELVRAAAAAAIGQGMNQYPPLPGLPVLREAIAAHQRQWYGLEFDPDREVLVTMGATEAVAASILACCEPGDEVIVFDPCYDAYPAALDLAQAVIKPVRLDFPDFAIDPDRLRAAFSDRTRLVLLNSPHNPTGKVFSATELELIAELAQRHDAWVLTDEVYEHLNYGTPHRPIAALPGMAERTLTVSSGGKTFSATGWKVGWVSGPAAAIATVRTVKQYLTFAGGGPFQAGIAAGLNQPAAEFAVTRDSLWHRRDQLCDGLAGFGLPVSVPAGGYFVVADLADWGVEDADEFCTDLPRRCGVAAIPVSAFYLTQGAGSSLVRFAFCKQPAVLQQGLERLATLPECSAQA